MQLERAHKLHMWEVEKDMQAREEQLRRQHDLVERESRGAAKRVQNAQKDIKEGDFNRQLNEQLIRNQGALREQLSAAERREAESAAKVTELEESLRDMTFHFESQIKILQEEGAAGELSGGQVGVEQMTPNARGKRADRRSSKGSRS